MLLIETILDEITQLEANGQKKSYALKEILPQIKSLLSEYQNENQLNVLVATLLVLELIPILEKGFIYDSYSLLGDVTAKNGLGVTDKFANEKKKPKPQPQIGLGIPENKLANAEEIKFIRFIHDRLFRLYQNLIKAPLTYEFSTDTYGEVMNDMVAKWQADQMYDFESTDLDANAALVDLKDSRGVTILQKKGSSDGEVENNLDGLLAVAKLSETEKKLMKSWILKCGGQNNHYFLTYFISQNYFTSPQVKPNEDDELYLPSYVQGKFNWSVEDGSMVYTFDADIHAIRKGTEVRNTIIKNEFSEIEKNKDRIESLVPKALSGYPLMKVSGKIRYDITHGVVTPHIISCRSEIYTDALLSPEDFFKNNQQTQAGHIARVAKNIKGFSGKNVFGYLNKFRQTEQFRQLRKEQEQSPLALIDYVLTTDDLSKVDPTSLEKAIEACKEVLDKDILTSLNITLVGMKLSNLIKNKIQNIHDNFINASINSLLNQLRTLLSQRPKHMYVNLSGLNFAGMDLSNIDLNMLCFENGNLNATLISLTYIKGAVLKASNCSKAILFTEDFLKGVEKDMRSMAFVALLDAIHEEVKSLDNRDDICLAISRNITNALSKLCGKQEQLELMDLAFNHPTFNYQSNQPIQNLSNNNNSYISSLVTFYSPQMPVYNPAQQHIQDIKNGIEYAKKYMN